MGFLEWMENSDEIYEKKVCKIKNAIFLKIRIGKGNRKTKPAHPSS